MENEKDYQPDILNFLEKIVQRNTLAYKEDFDVDKEILWNSAQESSLEHRSFLWMSRPCGTWCVPERETYLQDSRAYKTWTFYADQPNGIKAYRVVVDGVRDGKLAGKIIPLDYAKQVQRVIKSALPIAKVQYRDKDEYFCESSHETFIHRVLRLEENTHDIRYVPECEAELQRLLSLEHQMEKQDKNVEAYQLGAYVMQRMGINEGIMFRYHQKYFKEQNANESAYLDSMAVIEYDMLYGDKEVFGGENPYQPKNLKMGILPITLDRVLYKDGTMWLYGSNFNEFSIVIINGKQYEPTSQHQNLIKIEDLKLGGDLEVCVAQQDDYGKTILSTTRSCRVEVNH